MEGNADTTQLAVGDLVEVHGLKGSKELNGRWGRITAFVRATSRYGVKLEGVEDAKSLSAANLQRPHLSPRREGPMPKEVMESLPGTPIFKTLLLLLSAEALLALECCGGTLRRELRDASETWEQALRGSFGGTLAQARRRFPAASQPREAFAALAKLRRGLAAVEVVRGDLRDAAKFGVDAVILPANWSLEPRGPAATAVFEQAGPELRQYMAEHLNVGGDSDAERGLRAGEVCWTPGFGLGVLGIVHAVGPDRTTADGDGKLRQAYARALARVVDEGHRSVALASISTGGNGFRSGISARVAAEEIRAVLARSSLRVVVVAFEAEVEEAFRGALSCLQRRVNEDLLEQLPLLILDSMLPGQRLRFDVGSMPVAMATDHDRFAMVGMTRELGGLGVVPCGVEVEVLSRGTKLEVVASGRRFKLPGSPQRDETPPDEKGRHRFSASVLWIEEEEERPTPEDLKASAALEPLVAQWLALVRAGHERKPGHMDGVLQDLGPMPPARDATRRALWVCALINPLPGLGVAWEVRPRALMAETAAQRLDVATKGIRASIAHLDGSQPMR